ncbi:hypothetical protein QSB47_004744 [Escherichia coli]|nr:hypothetical protein [Escherichia coli]ELR3423168.1 hypothetical protein [Escherichia coli]
MREITEKWLSKYNSERQHESPKKYDAGGILTELLFRQDNKNAWNDT